MKNRDITAIILAGGKSTRMGIDKGLMQYNGRYMIQYVIDVARDTADNIIIIANNSAYRSFGYTVFSDIIKNCGPMGGIYTGLVHSHTEYNLVLGCDMPFIKLNVARHIIRKSNGYEAAVPVIDGKLEPLCAVYRKECSEKFKEYLLRGELKMSECIRKLHVNLVDMAGLKSFDTAVFQNMNSPFDLLFTDES